MLKSIQQKLILAACALSPSLMAAAPVSVDEAKDIAAEFFQSGEVLRLADRDAFELAHTAVDQASNPICYVFNARDGKGFVIVSADDASLPVIGYSDISTWNSSSVSNSVERLLLEDVKVSADTRRRVMARASAQSEKKVLSTPEWSQEAPFNNMIPNRRLTGCVGVALAEILKYHNYPANRPASLADSRSEAYDWAGMRMDNYRGGYSEQEANAVAALVADAAIGIGTDFGMSSSSAYEVKVPYALTSLFGYDGGVSYKKRQEMDRDAWDQVIVNEIDADRPVLYCGQDVSAGHAFVCDGYEMRGSTPYFHINWGWGGSANGFYATDALNPVVSKAHSYNDLMTIVYNIKPAADDTRWSDLHITSDERQPGLTLNVSDISAADSFSVRAGAVKNISNSDFSGQIAVALFDASGNMKCLLSDARNFSLWALQVSKYVDFSCKLPAGTAVADSDKVRIVSKAGGASDWLPVAGDPLAPGEVSAKHYEVPYLKVTLPSSNSFYTITAPESQAILGRDFVFTLTQLDPSRLITLKANGYILTPDASGNYCLSNVLENQSVTVTNQVAANVLSKSTLWVTAGNLQNILSDEECASVKDLTLYGTINVNDFNFIRDRMRLERLDISQVSILASGSNPANAIPAKAFQGYTCLRQIILPNNLTTLKNGCFNRTGLTSVDIPASVSTWEYNVFLSCGSLQQVVSRRSSPAWINWCVFNGTPKAKLVVPAGAKAAYEAKEYWQDFKEIVEGLPAEPSEFTVKFAEKKGLKYIKVAYEDYYYKGDDPLVFKVETDSSFDDAVLQVYCNSTRLTPDAAGKYTVSITCNSLIHVEVQQPQPTTVDTTWKLTGDAGGIGLATDVVNVPVGQRFTVRANAIKVPKGDDAAKFYAMVLTNKDGAIKEFISSVQSNYYSREAANLTANFYCQVNEAKVAEGNMVRLATSYNKKDWQLVDGESDAICSSLAAVGNPVVYHQVTMPSSVTGARIEGGASEVVRGMPFSLKVSAIDPAQRVTVGVNGYTKALKVAVANISIPAVTEDLDITIMVTDAEEGDYMVYNIQEGQLAAKLAECPTRVKLIGSMYVSDFDALRENASTIIDLDMADVTVKGAAMTGNSIPENAFAPKAASSLSALRSVILPNNLERIDKNAFARCTQISEITIPANVSYIGAGAFSACVGLKKIVAKPKVAPTCGNTSPFPANPSSITLEVPKGSEESYSVPSTWWAMLSLYKAPVEHKDYYWLKLDKSRVGVNTAWGYNGDINNIPVGQTEVVKAVLVLPNSQSEQFKPYDHVRPDVPFKVYDNGNDVFNNSAPYSNTESGLRITPEQSWSQIGGLMQITWNPAATSGVTMPQNHEIELYFYYDVTFENKEGAQGVTAHIVEVPEGCEWKNVAMNKFHYMSSNGWEVNPEVKPVLYREGSELKFQLDNVPSKTKLDVTLMTKVMTKTGYSPEYEEREMTLEANNGIYTIPALQGDCWVRISGTEIFEEGDVIPADYLNSMDKEEAVSYNELSVSGEMTEEEFEQVRENFDNVETIDLTAIENTSLPENAFEGMDKLVDVIISENVTEIGAGCFKDCSSIESLTLPGVTSIGEGAFEGCESLTSILLPSLGASGASGKPGMSRAGEVSGVTAESFRGLSPNCLIYIGENEIPGTEGLNIILNKGGQRVAASDIVLDGNHPFNAPASFMLGEHTISMTADVAASLACDIDNGWTTVMLPFKPTGWELGEKFAEREGSGLHILSFDGEDAEQLTPQTEILPNRPYLANVSAPFASVPVTFFASEKNKDEAGETAYDVPYTPVPEETVAIGKDFSLYGSYDGQTRPVTCFMLNEEGSRFVRSASSSGVQTVKPFSAYLVANDGIADAEMAVGDHPLWIMDPESAGATGTNLYRSNLIELESLTKNASIYYTVDGSDPVESEGSRKLFTAPFAMEGEAMTVRAVAEYKGFVSDPVTLDFRLKRSKLDFDLEGKWNWISHNVETPVSVADFATSGISGILSQTQEVVLDPVHGLVGGLKELLPTVGYKVCLSDDSWKGTVAGVAFDPIASVKLAKGWNWIGSPADEGSLLIEDLLSGLEAEEGDMLVGLDGFVQLDADNVWQGTLSHMVPGTGYMYFSNSDKEFVYNLVKVRETEVPAKAPVAVEGYWTVDNHRYASVMPVVASLEGIGDIEDYQVAAFCGKECRGIGAIVNGLMMINVHGNPGDVIGFRFIDAQGEQKLSSSEIVFGQNPEGTFARPFAIETDGATGVASVNVDGFGLTYDDGRFIIDGDMSDVKAVEIYDLSGKMIARSLGKRALEVGNIDGNVVTVVVRKADSASSVKMLVK